MKAYAKANVRDPERSKLIADHIEVGRRIALRVARRIPPWLSQEDLVAAAMIGLTEAADRYDASRGEPFVAFAEKRIRGAVLDELRRGDMMPRRVRNTARKVGETIRALEQSLGRPPEDEEIARALGVPVEEYRDELEVLNHVSLVDMGTEQSELDRTFARAEQESPADLVERAEMATRVRACLDKLQERDALILSLYYVEEFNYSEIGDLLGVSESRVCQLHSRALTRLRAEFDAPAPNEEAPRSTRKHRPISARAVPAPEKTRPVASSEPAHQTGTSDAAAPPDETPIENAAPTRTAFEIANEIQLEPREIANG